MTSHNYIENFLRERIIEESISLNKDKGFYRELVGHPVKMSQAQRIDNQTTIEYHTKHIEIIQLVKLYKELCPYEFEKNQGLQTLKRETENAIKETNDFLVERLEDVSEYHRNLEEMGESDLD